MPKGRGYSLKNPPASEVAGKNKKNPKSKGGKGPKKVMKSNIKKAKTGNKGMTTY